jgi:hypothetical protein
MDEGSNYPHKSGSVWIFTAALVLRNGAESNRFKHRSLIVESGASKSVDQAGTLPKPM